MSNKCKVLVLGEGQDFSSDDKTLEKQKQQIKECRKQKFDTFKEKFNSGFKGSIKAQVDNVKQVVGKLSKDK